MPILASLLLGLFGSLAEYFAKWVTKKVAGAAAAMAVFAALTAALFATASGIVSGLALVYPDVPGLGIGLYLVNTPALLGAVSSVIAFDSAVYLYRYNLENLKIVNYIT